MSKKGSLSHSLQAVARGKERPIAAEHNPSGRSQDARPPSRVGKKAIAGFFDEAVSKQLRRLGLDQDKSVQDLLGEALNDLFEKYGLSRLA
jgi:hypothetical protein